MDKKSMCLGVGLVVVFAVVATLLAELEFVRSLSFSPLIVGIIIGMVFANTARRLMPEEWGKGIKFCSKTVLRTGVVLYGFKLTVQQVIAIGLPAIAIDCVIVFGTIGIGLALGKALKMDLETTLLTSTGSAICGAAAVLGAEPVVKGAPHKTAIAVSTVVIFGTLSMFLYPIMYRLGWLDSLSQDGLAIYVGSTLHEVAHVVGAGNAIDQAGGAIADAATITKMIRVILLAPVLIIMSVALAKFRGGETGGKSKITVPWFAIYFILVILFNSLIIYSGVMGEEAYSSIVSAINKLDIFLLTMAMTALGCETSIDKFGQAGVKPFALALGLYVWLLVGGYFLACLI